MADEFPALCSDCCGPSKNIKMVKQQNGEECKSCTRPFTVFRWNNKTGSRRSKKTIICITCARAKHCCQSCMLDIVYRIPLEIRDTALKMAGLEGAFGDAKMLGEGPAFRETKAIKADRAEAAYRNQDETMPASEKEKKAREMLEKLSLRLTEKEAHSGQKSIKSAKELLKIDLKSGDIQKVVSKLPFGGLLADDDATCTSFFVFGFDETFPQYMLTDYCSKFGTIKSIVMVHRAKCAFVTFSSKLSAQAFATEVDNNGFNNNKKTAGILVIEKYFMRAAWGHPTKLGYTNDDQKKIRLVADSVMRQLAEKDNKSKPEKRPRMPRIGAKKA